MTVLLRWHIQSFSNIYSAAPTFRLLLLEQTQTLELRPNNYAPFIRKPLEEKKAQQEDSLLSYINVTAYITCVIIRQ